MIAAIIQARMGSTRLPGKVLRKVGDKPLLLHQLERVKKAQLLDKVIVATSVLPQDDEIALFCEKEGIECFRGSEDDVLKRYYDCAKIHSIDTIVRLTADCPLVAPEIIDQMVTFFEENDFDYAANTIPPEKTHFPNGSDVEIFTFDALKRADEEAVEVKDREHVTFYFWQNDHGFKTGLMDCLEDWSKYRITVDYPEDLGVVAKLFDIIERNGSCGSLEDIINILKSDESLFKKNQGHLFGEGWS